MKLLKFLLALRQRQTWVLLHRWVGLVMTGFLVIAGLSGSLIAFYAELDAWLVPELHLAPPPYADAPMLDAVRLRERVLAAQPALYTDSALAPWRPGRTLSLWMDARDEAGTPIDNEWFVDPYSGEIRGSRRWGDVRQGTKNLMPFIYHLHYSLALGTVGTYAFGIVALLWTLDCFVGAYLTLPRGRPFFAKWRPAWAIKRKRFNFDLHRASGLWTWAMLFVLAWSSVAFNLGEVYRPVMRSLLPFAAAPELPPRAAMPDDHRVHWPQALQRGRIWMAEAAPAHGLMQWREDALRYDATRGEFTYWVATRLRSNGEAMDWFGVSFDALSGERLRVQGENRPAERAGDTVTRWLLDLHMAKVWGLPYRIFVCMMGLVVVALSITGLVIWWRKRRAARHAASRRRPAGG